VPEWRPFFLEKGGGGCFGRIETSSHSGPAPAIALSSETQYPQAGCDGFCGHAMHFPGAIPFLPSPKHTLGLIVSPHTFHTGMFSVAGVLARQPPCVTSGAHPSRQLYKLFSCPTPANATASGRPPPFTPRGEGGGGFPPRTQLMAEERGLRVDVEGFNRKMKEEPGPAPPLIRRGGGFVRVPTAFNAVLKMLDNILF